MRKIFELVQVVSNDYKVKTPVISNQNARLSLSVIRLMKLMFKVHYAIFRRELRDNSSLKVATTMTNTTINRISI